MIIKYFIYNWAYIPLPSSIFHGGSTPKGGWGEKRYSGARREIAPHPTPRGAHFPHEKWGKEKKALTL
ncbi:MAG: hypothetical protein COA91_10160 [Robiginitomaculum sp.]|nr:MAG: hypothetical protein COA91_10160 [Robiginitomaculum sp.]